MLDAMFKGAMDHSLVVHCVRKSDNRLVYIKERDFLYTKLRSQIQSQLEEEKIQTCLIFVDLRGGINTGKSDSAIDYGKRDVFGTFEEHLQKVLEWKKNPDEFIKELIEQPTQDSLHEAIKEKLADDSK